MEKVTLEIGETSKTYDLETIHTKDHNGKIKFFSSLDCMMVSINKKKYESSKEVLKYLDSIRIPRTVSHEKITLLSLFYYFQKEYINKTFIVDFKKYNQIVQDHIGYSFIEIITKPNNFPHLIGIRGKRDEFGNVINRDNVREFLDGVLYQWILLGAHDGIDIDYNKLSVLHWIYNTLTNPAYILPKSAIKRNGRIKFDADLIFVSKISNSLNYAYHVVGLIQEKDSRYAFKSQFAISKRDQKRFYTTFDTKKAIYDFLKR